MKKKLKYLLCSILLIALSLTISFQFTYAESLSYLKERSVSNGELIDGVNYENLIATTSNASGVASLQNISYVKANKGSVKLVAWSQNKKDGITGNNVKNLAMDFEEKNPGYMVLAGINSDYFSTSGGLFYPINALVSDGNVIKYNNHAKYLSLGFKSDGSAYELNKTNTVSSCFYLTIYDKTGSYPIKEVALGNQNTLPTTNQTTFFYKYSVATTSSTATMFEIASPLCYFNQASIYIKGSVTNTVKTTTSNPIIASTDNEVIKLLENNPVIRIQKNMSDNMKNYDNILGVGSQPLKNGIIQTVSAIGDQNASFTTARHPRSSVGFDAEGNAIICAIDGRQTNMAGASLQEEASIMKNLGCVDCYNFDGGGSTELVIRKNNSLVYLNSPSEKYRNVVDALLFVVPINDSQIKINKSTEKVSVTLENNCIAGSKINSQKALINGIEIENIDNEIVLNNYNEEEANYFTTCTNVTYNSKTYTIYQTEKFYLSDVEDIKPKKEKPSDFKISVTKSGTKLEVLVTCVDLSNTLTKLYVQYGENKVIAIKGANGYLATINGFNETSVDFSILYYYIIDSITPISETYEDTFRYNIYDNYISYYIFPNDVVNNLYNYLSE